MLNLKINYKNIKYVFIAFVILIVIFAVFKMTSKNQRKQNNESQNEKQVVYQDNIKFGISNFDSMNPLLTRNKQLMDIYQLVYEPLVTLDKNFKVQPCLATEYAKTSARTYIVKINNSIKWSDGSNLTADDVKFTVDLLKSRDNIYSDNVKKIDSVEAIDSNTVKFNLNEETSFFEYNLIFPIMCKSYYEEDNFFETTKYHIGTGMYKISTTSAYQIVLEKNENYRNQENISKHINKIYINVYTEIGEAYNSFKIGNIDVLSTSSLSYEDYIGTIGYYVKEYKGRECDFLSCNCDDYLMQDKSVRQAISYGIDKENIVSTVFNNKYYISENVLDYGNYLYDRNTAFSGYNAEKAKEILANGGWIYNNNRWRKNGKILAITITTNSGNNKRKEVVENIKGQLENIGIQVNIREVSDNQYYQILQNKNYQVILTGIYNGYNPDLSYFYGDNNIANYKNDEVKSIISEVKNITDQKLLQEKYKRIMELEKEDSIYISLYRNRNSLLINQNVIGNFEPTNYNAFRNFESWNKE